MDEQVNIQQHHEEQHINEHQQEQQTRTIFDKRMSDSQRILNDSKGRNNPDSDEMTAVKRELTNVTGVLAAHMSANHEEFRNQITELKDHYNNLIRACDHYLETKWTSRFYFFGQAHRRRRMVESLRDMAVKEASCLSGLSKDKEAFKTRMEGGMVGTAISGALRDYQAVRENLNIGDLQRRGDAFVGFKINRESELQDEYTVGKKPAKLADGVKSNVCATRLAGFMGMDGMIKRSELVIARDAQNRSYYGMKTEGQSANMMTLAEIKAAQGRQSYNITYSGDALKQISNLRVFHMLLGGKNLNLEDDVIMIFQKEKLGGDAATYQIVGAYLDCTGTLFSDDGGTGTIEALLKKKDFLMSTEMADAVLNLEARDLEYVAGDTLSAKQREAFEKRLSYLKNWTLAQKEKEAAEGADKLMEDSMWRDPENLEIVRDRLNSTRDGFFKGILKQNSVIEETDAEDLPGFMGEFQSIYRELKKSIESTRDQRQRVLMIGGLSERIPYFEKKFQDHAVAQDMVTDIQARLIGEFMSEDFLKAYNEEKWKNQATLADAYEEEKKQNPDDPELEYNVVNENRTAYRDLMLLDSFGIALVSATGLGRNLKHNRMGSYSYNFGAGLLEANEEKEKIRKNASTATALRTRFEAMDGGSKYQKLRTQVTEWADKYYQKDPKQSLRERINKVEEIDAVEAAIPADATEVKKAYAVLKNFKTFVLPQPPVYTGAPDDQVALLRHKNAEEAFRNEVTNTGLLFMQFYTSLRNEIDKYAVKKKLTMGINPVVDDFFKKITKERVFFSNMVSEFLAGHKTYKKNTTWNDIIKQGTKTVYNVGGLKNLGGGTSDVYKILGKEGKNRYFKPEENLQKDRVSTFKQVLTTELQKFMKDDKLKPEEKQEIKYLALNLQRAIEKDYNDTFEGSEPYLYNVITKPMVNYQDGGSFRENTAKFFKKACYGTKVREPKFEKIYKEITQPQKLVIEGEEITVPGPQIFQVFDFLRNKKDLSPACLKAMRDFAAKVMTDFVFKLNQFEVSTDTAKIPAGRNISDRNVFTSRAAGILGIGHLVAYSETAVAQKDGKQITGNLMEEAKGEMIKIIGKKVTKQGGKVYLQPEKQRYSVRAIKDINTMRIFDILLGQVDRHEENFHYITHQEGDTKVLDSVHMIDNDMCGGTLTVEDIKQGRGVAMPYDREELRALPNELLEKLRNLDINTLKLMGGGILNKKEFSSLEERLQFIKSEIREIDKEQQALYESEKEEDIEKAFLMQDENYRALMFMKYERSKLMKDKKEPGDQRFRPFATAGLPTLADIMKEITKLKTAKKAEFETWKQERLQKKAALAEQLQAFENARDEEFYPALENINGFCAKLKETLKSGKVEPVEKGFTEEQLNEMRLYGLDTRCVDLLNWSDAEKDADPLKDKEKKEPRIEKLKMLHMYDTWKEDLEDSLKDLKKRAKDLKSEQIDKQIADLEKTVKNACKTAEKEIKDIKKEYPELDTEIPLIWVLPAQDDYVDGAHPTEDATQTRKAVIRLMDQQKNGQYFIELDNREQKKSERGVVLHTGRLKNQLKKGKKLPGMQAVNADQKPAYKVELTDDLFAQDEVAAEQQQKELFPNGKFNEDHIIQMSSFGNDCYILAPLYALVKTNPDYIKNVLVKDYGNDGTHAVVHLFDVNGNPVDIVVSKKRTDKVSKESGRPLWLNMVEKAANYLIGQQNADFRKAASFREKKGADMSKVSYQKGTLRTFEMSDGSEELGMRLLFGMKAASFTTRNQGDHDYDEFLISNRYAHQAGDEAIAKIFVNIEKGNMVVASTCTNGGERFYDSAQDRVKFNYAALKPKHVYTVLGEGELKNGQRTVRVRDPYGGEDAGVQDVPFVVFKRCFTDVYTFNTK